jgi:Tol biopolymer transport system component
MPAAGEPPAVPLATEEENYDPACSPDGTQIAFISSRDGTAQTWVMPTSGEPATQLTFPPIAAETPCWSPDGTQIAFRAYTAEDYGIWIVPSAGGQPIQLTTHSSDFNPSWSPDGTQIAFSSTRSGSIKNIWVVTLNTAGVEPAAATAAGALRLASPNPFSDATEFRLPEMAGALRSASSTSPDASCGSSCRPPLDRPAVNRPSSGMDVMTAAAPSRVASTISCSNPKAAVHPGESFDCVKARGSSR